MSHDYRGCCNHYLCIMQISVGRVVLVYCSSQNAYVFFSLVEKWHPHTIRSIMHRLISFGTELLWSREKQEGDR